MGERHDNTITVLCACVYWLENQPQEQAQQPEWGLLLGYFVIAPSSVDCSRFSPVRAVVEKTEEGQEMTLYWDCADTYDVWSERGGRWLARTTRNWLTIARYYSLPLFTLPGMPPDSLFHRKREELPVMLCVTRVGFLGRQYIWWAQ
jgi:hypothetical protein